MRKIIFLFLIIQIKLFSQSVSNTTLIIDSIKSTKSFIMSDGTVISSAAGTGDFVLTIPAVNTQTVSYTLVLTDKNKFLDINAASTNTVTVPSNASVAFPVGTVITITQLGTGQVVFVAGGGVNINSDTSKTKIAAQFGVACLRKTDIDTWLLFGNLSL